MCACMLSHFSLFWLFVTLWIVACQAPLSIGISRQEYWSGLLWPTLGNLPKQKLNPHLFTTPSLPLSHQGSPLRPYQAFFFFPKSCRTMRFVYKSQLKRFTGCQINQLTSFNKVYGSLASPLPSKRFFMSGNEKQLIFLILWDLNLEGLCIHFHLSLQNSYLCMCMCMYELMSSCNFVKYIQ